MAFTNSFLETIPQTGGGEEFGGASINLSETDFENGLKTSRFAQFLGTVLSNINATATPRIAGVIKRNVGGSIEAGNTIDKSEESNANYTLSGLVSVDALASDTPEKHEAILMINTNDADAGKATVTASGDTVATTAIFIRLLDASTWVINIK